MKPFDPRRKRLWCHGPKPEYALDTDWADQWYIADRTIALVRPSIDVIILPGGNSQTREFFEFCHKTLGLKKEQTLWTSGKSYLLDDDIYRELMPELLRTVNPREWEVIPYSVTQPFTSWASQLSAPIFGDEEAFARKYSDKSILHSNVFPELREKAVPLLPEEVENIRVARGYTCTNKEELLAAYDLLVGAGCTEGVIIKPTQGTTGERILIIHRRDQLASYDFPMGKVVLEELLPVDRDKAGKIISPSVQYNGRRILGRITDQTFKGVAYEGNIIPSKTSPQFQRELLEMARRILKWLNPKGPGGFDFLSVEGKPVFSDPNIGRFTGAHPARIFRSLYAPRAFFQCWKIEPPINSVWEFWERLREKDLAFQPKLAERGGIFPLCWLPDMWGMLVAFGRNRKEVERLRQKAEDLGS